jgi:hypothetical protein
MSTDKEDLGVSTPVDVSGGGAAIRLSRTQWVTRKEAISMDRNG